MSDKNGEGGRMPLVITISVFLSVRPSAYQYIFTIHLYVGLCEYAKMKIVQVSIYGWMHGCMDVCMDAWMQMETTKKIKKMA